MIPSSTINRAVFDLGSDRAEAERSVSWQPGDIPHRPRCTPENHEQCSRADARASSGGRGRRWFVTALALLLGACANETPARGQAQGEGLPPAEFVASSRGQVYYWTGCDNWRSLQPANLRWFATEAEAQAAGYRPSTARGCRSPDARQGPTPAQTATCTVTRIVDGDTVDCEEAAERIRLLLIDAPEAQQGVIGVAAHEALERMLPPGSRARVELDVQERDRYGRILAYLYTPDGIFVNEAMARSGFAVVAVFPPNVRHVERIRAAVEDARRARRGIWAIDGFACMPGDFRAGRCE